jgi:hypothetical protein
MEDLSLEKIIKIWDWLGDGGVFFLKEKGDIFSNCPHQMLKCFNVLLYNRGKIYISLQSKEICQNNGLHDPMECIASYETYNIPQDEAIEITMINEDAEKLDFIEVERTIKIKTILNTDCKNCKPIILHGVDYLNSLSLSGPNHTIVRPLGAQ